MEQTKNHPATTPTAETNKAAQKDFLKKLESTPDAAFMETEAKYKTFAEGEVVNAVYEGIAAASFKNAAGEIEEKPAVRFVALVDDEPVTHICANAALVNQMKRLTPPMPVRITCTGTEKTAKGKLTTFNVKALPTE